MRTLNRANKQGFTFVEVMCVMIIISIVSSIALPAINNFHSADRCKAEASVLVSCIRQAKYQAMQDNCLNRIIFLKDGTSASSFKVQKFDPDTETTKTFDTIIQEDSHTTSGGASGSQASYDSNDWKTIADEDEIEFNSSVDVDLTQLGSITTFYFKPDGYIYYFNSTIQILHEQRIIFKYGSSAVAVDINALGVISSEAVATDEVEENGGIGGHDDKFFDDKYNPTKDNSTYTGTETDTN